MTEPAHLPPPGGSPSALALTAPVAMGYLPLGAVFGFLFVQAGAEWWLAVLASIIVYAGAAQYMMIPMVVAGLPVGAIALATLVVNLRHVFYGLSLLHKMPPGRLQRGYMIFALTDETYSLLTTLPDVCDPRQRTRIALLNQIWWVLGSGTGALAGATAQMAVVGLDFALVALFAVLTVEQWRSSARSAPLWVAAVAYAVAHLVAAEHALLLAMVLSVAAGACWRPDSSVGEGSAK